MQEEEEVDLGCITLKSPSPSPSPCRCDLCYVQNSVSCLRVDYGKFDSCCFLCYPAGCSRKVDFWSVILVLLSEWSNTSVVIVQMELSCC